MQDFWIKVVVPKKGKIFTLREEKEFPIKARDFMAVQTQVHRMYPVRYEFSVTPVKAKA